MIKLYFYIFAKSYIFCMNIFKEREFPHAFGTTVITLTFASNILIFTGLVEYLFSPTWLNTFESYIPYFALFLWFLLFFVLHYRDNYIIVLGYIEKMSLKFKRRLKYISIIYLLFSFVFLILIGWLLRKVNGYS
jgi:hypothetical protein